MALGELNWDELRMTSDPYPVPIFNKSSKYQMISFVGDSFLHFCSLLGVGLSAFSATRALVLTSSCCWADFQLYSSEFCSFSTRSVIKLECFRIGSATFVLSVSDNCFSIASIWFSCSPALVAPKLVFVPFQGLRLVRVPDFHEYCNGNVFKNRFFILLIKYKCALLFDKVTVLHHQNIHLHFILYESDVNLFNIKL